MAAEGYVAKKGGGNSNPQNAISKRTMAFSRGTSASDLRDAITSRAREVILQARTREQAERVIAAANRQQVAAGARRGNITNQNMARYLRNSGGSNAIRLIKKNRVARLLGGK